MKDVKDAARRAGFARRKTAFETADQIPAQTHLREVLADFPGAVLSGYMPIRTEISPLPVMEEWSARANVCVPVITAASQPLEFHQWQPTSKMIAGAFGAMIPENGPVLEPDIVIVPLVAFSRAGGRLGYGGGFYDRTLEGLRARKKVFAVGFAFSAQEDASVPLEAIDQPLDAIVTETGLILPH